MKIVEQTSTHLKLTDQNQQWLWGTLFGTPFAVVGLVITLAVSNVTRLDCQRTNPTHVDCQRTIAGLVGKETAPIPGAVINARVATAYGTGVVLSTSKGQVELVNHRVTIRDTHYQIADAITAFAKNPQQSQLTIQQDDRWEGLIEGGAFLLPGVVVVLASLAIPTTTFCCFDKTSGQMTLEKRYRIGTKKISHSPLSDIRRALVIQLPPSARKPIYAVQLETVAGKTIGLSPAMRDREQCQVLADKINQFLG